MKLKNFKTKDKNIEKITTDSLVYGKIGQFNGILSSLIING